MAASVNMAITNAEECQDEQPGKLWCSTRRGEKTEGIYVVGWRNGTGWLRFTSYVNMLADVRTLSDLAL